MAHTVILFALIALAVFVNALPEKRRSWNPRRWTIRGRRHHGLVPPPNGNGKKVANANAGNYLQHVDHFSNNTKIFSQRYWWSQIYYSAGGPVFLMIEGESEASPFWIEYEDIPFFKMARENNATAFVLEHRYYGFSQPTNDLSTNNMKYLSSRQALEDTAEFIQAMTAKFNLQGAKWITFGGSYSGALSAWMRLKYPDLVFGAVATSGPILAEVDFVEYMEVVQSAVTEHSVVCAENIRLGFQQVQGLMASAPGRRQLEKIFSTCDSLDDGNEDDIKNFYEAIMGNYMSAAQYGGDNAGMYRYAVNVEKLCSFHLDDSVDPVQQLGNVNDYLMPYFGEYCLDFMFQPEIDCMKEISAQSDCAGIRAWIWQTCTEFGYYQTTNSKTAGDFFGRTVGLDYFMHMCEQVFGSQYNNATVFDAVDKTNQFYGGRNNFKATRVVFPNGSQDPWHALGMLQGKFPDYISVYMKGTAHCADMYEPRDDDLESLKTGRQSIELQVATWVYQ